ncbi:MAG TPA: ribonuclease P protein component [Chthoniobacteraceae bacterium]|jgi:ribonuclease P protein component
MNVRLRFSKSARLTRAPEFQKLRREGASFHGKYFVLSVLTNLPGVGAPRAGFITSRKVGGAVVRNRVRRRLREIFRAAQPRLARGVWLVLVARQHAARASFRQLEAEWRQLARRSGILTPEVAPPCSP